LTIPPVGSRTGCGASCGCSPLKRRVRRPIQPLAAALPVEVPGFGGCVEQPLAHPPGPVRWSFWPGCSSPLACSSVCGLVLGDGGQLRVLLAVQQLRGVAARDRAVVVCAAKVASCQLLGLGRGLGLLGLGIGRRCQQSVAVGVGERAGPQRSDQRHVETQDQQATAPPWASGPLQSRPCDGFGLAGALG
jgi:hypothetical protein